MRKFRKQFYIIANKIPTQELKMDSKMPLFSTELSAFIEEQHSFD